MPFEVRVLGVTLDGVGVTLDTEGFITAKADTAMLQIGRVWPSLVLFGLTRVSLTTMMQLSAVSSIFVENPDFTKTANFVLRCSCC